MKKTLVVLLLSVATCLVLDPAPAYAQDCRGCVENIDPDPVGSSGSCPTAVDYQSCIKRCDCQYAANRKKCGTSPMCIDIATSERNACYGNCMTDYTAATGLPLIGGRVPVEQLAGSHPFPATSTAPLAS